MNQWASWAVAVLMSVVVASVATAQQRTSATETAKKLPAAEQTFLMKAAQHGKAEVALGKLATERGTSPAVKQFGERMVADHGKAGEELARLAEQTGVTLPAEPDAAHKQVARAPVEAEG
jgi:putative membrane protein